MPVLRGGGRGEMKECSQIAIAIFSGIVITCIVFFISRHLDFVFLNAFPSAICAVAKDKYIASFDSYKDFVTIITAILTLIVAALGIASYISFKEVRGKSKDIMDEFDQIRVTINQECNRIKAFSIISQAKAMADESKGSMSVISLLRKAEELDSALSLPNIFIGSEYCKTGIENYIAAKDEYEKALSKDSSSALACFGLSKAEFKIASMYNCMPNVAIEEIKNWEEVDIVKIKIASPKLLTKKVELIESAISHMNMALAYGFAKDECCVVLGQLYEAVSNDEFALKYYKKGYMHNESNYTSGFFYCATWLRVNRESIESSSELKKIIEILKVVCQYDSMCDKLAYALLWYIYRKISDCKMAGYVSNFTTEYAFNEMFVIAPAEELGATPCSSSQA